MTTVVYLAMPRDEVIPYLGPKWPPAEGATVLRCPNQAGVTDGAVIVYQVEGKPGTTWWLVDGVIPPQDAGPVDEALAALIPESVLETPEPAPPPTPPWTQVGVTAADEPQ